MKKVYYYNKIVYNILTERPLILSNFLNYKRVEREIVISLVTSFFLDWHKKEYLIIYIAKYKRHYREVFWTVKKYVDLARNKNFHLENSMILYGICKTETIEKIVNTI